MEGKKISIDWHLTYRCNLNCLHCSVVSEYKDFVSKYYPTKTLTKQELHDFVDFLTNNKSNLFSIHFSPNIGESTTHPNFVHLWNELSSLSNVNMLGITTNGVMLHHILSKMHVEKLKNLVISMDGDEQTHDKIRGKGTFKNTYKSLQMIDEVKHYDNNFYLQINFVLNKLNATALGRLLFLLEELESKNIIINVMRLDCNSGNAKLNRDILKIDKHEIANAIRNAYEKLKILNDKGLTNNKSPIKIRLVGFPARYLLEISQKIQNIRHFDLVIPHSGWKNSCSAYNGSTIYLDPYGNMFPCQQFINSSVLDVFYSKMGYITIPNLRDNFNSIDDIINSKFFLNARNWIGKLYNSISCTSCKLKASCTICPIYVHLHGFPPECSSFKPNRSWILTEEGNLINFSTGKMYKVNVTGREILQLIAEGKDEKEICTILSNKYPSYSDHIVNDVKKFMALLGGD